MTSRKTHFMWTDRIVEKQFKIKGLDFNNSYEHTISI